MASCVRLTITQYPKLYLVGRPLSVDYQAMMATGDNPIPAFWDECFFAGLFDKIEACSEALVNTDYVGWMGNMQPDGTGLYVCGMLFTKLEDGTQLPKGTTVIEIAAGEVAIAWIKGANVAEVCSQAHEHIVKALADEGRSISPSDVAWSMEVYNCPRFTDPDEEGCIILDYVVPLA